MFLARLAVELGFLLLIATAVNVPMALSLLRRRLDVNLLHQVHSTHPELERWVWQPPVQSGEWPAPTHWAVYRGPGLTYYTISSDQSNHRYQMEVQLAGFPFRAVALPQMWWPDSAYTTHDPDNPPDPGVQLQWIGVLLNPLILAGGAWVLLVAPFELFFAARWRRRLGRRLCPYCAYPAGRADVCTECGRAAVVPLRG